MAAKENNSEAHHTLIIRLGKMKTFLADLNLKAALPDLYGQVTQKVTPLFDAHGSAFYTYNQKNNELKLVCVHNLRPEIEGLSLKADQGLLGDVVSQQKTLKIDDYKTWVGRSKLFEEDQYSSLMETPLICSNGVYGVLGLVRIGECESFHDIDMLLLDFLSQMLSIVFELRA